MKGGRKYKAQGDAFSHAVHAGQGPRTAVACTHARTGRHYARRVNVDECRALSAGTIPTTWARTLPGLAWVPGSGAISLDVLPESVWVAFAPLTARRTAPRRLICPHCTRPCRSVYASPYGPQGQPDEQVGCRACLGLTHPARQRHKCPDWAAQVLEHPQNHSPTTRRRALQVINGSASRILHAVRLAGHIEPLEK
ncbi:hypothetical protein [Deinococcus radiotolerans]|uniref:Transposase n=1 Tax=Deinococcus radiotolerans TaxID=1309407 RepID=A0ABQ2FH37_9DEIO|nr:hypothetical protein [Deinococcus radiotolerans]GGK90966.1 hypothetical protein GCM10010844_06910 [Deinococcus radiotolerans]